jgi:hypothetical protein
VSDCRLEFFLRGINPEEFDQSCDASCWIFRKLGEVDAKHWNLGVRFDEPFMMFQERSLQSLASRIVGGEPLATMFVASILKRTDIRESNEGRGNR